MGSKKDKEERLPECSVVGCKNKAIYFVADRGPICAIHLDVARSAGLTEVAWLIDPDYRHKHNRRSIELHIHSQ